ncbi:MAG: pentapeptide repeat-containing protein [Geitlerinemataceae cyanobacterium]
MTRDMFQSDFQQPESMDSRSAHLTPSAAHDVICDYILALIKSASPEEALYYFKKIFLEEDSIEDPKIKAALNCFFSFRDREEFTHTLKRCCYILINNLHATRNSRHIVDMIENFDRFSEKDRSWGVHVSLLKSWIICFVQSSDYLDLKKFVSPIIYSTRHKKEKINNWSSRYSSYLLVSQSLDVNNPEEQREFSRILSQQIRDKFKFDLAMYTARSESPSSQFKNLTNPTKLGNTAISLIKQIVSKHNLFKYADRARIWIDRAEQLNYKEFKKNLLEYAVVSSGEDTLAISLKNKLSEKLETLYSNNDPEPVNRDLILRTCKRTIDFFTIENGQDPSLLFILLTNGGNPIALVIILLKIIMICSSARPHLELCIAKLIQYYENYPEKECRWFINFVEIFNLIFTIYIENIRYDLVKVTDDGSEHGVIEHLDGYRLFCQAQGLKLGDRDWSGADLSGADLRRAELQNGKLSGANLSQVSLHGAKLSDADLSHADLQYTNLSRADLSRADLRRANLSHANLRGASLKGANLTGANLSHADLDCADLSGVDLSRAILRRSSLRYANLTQANLSHADLTRAQLNHVNLSHTDLTDSFLRHTNLSNSVLIRAHLTGANLFNTNLVDAVVNGAIFGGNSGLSPEVQKYLIFRGAMF